MFVSEDSEVRLGGSGHAKCQQSQHHSLQIDRCFHLAKSIFL